MIAIAKKKGAYITKGKEYKIEQFTNDENSISSITIFDDWKEFRTYIDMTLWEINDTTVDTINPEHYTYGGIETIDFIEAKLSPEMYKGYLLGTIIAYLSRESHKNGKEDIEKAHWYLDRLFEFIKKED